MSRVVRVRSLAAQRRSLLKALASALGRWRQTPGPDASERRDLAAFCLEQLHGLEALTETTTSAWEKRGYWMKADRYRMEWRWVAEAQRLVLEAATLLPPMPLPAPLDELWQSRLAVHFPHRAPRTPAWQGASSAHRDDAKGGSLDRRLP
jgi:hypothetical protein